MTLISEVRALTNEKFHRDGHYNLHGWVGRLQSEHCMGFYRWVWSESHQGGKCVVFAVPTSRLTTETMAATQGMGGQETQSATHVCFLCDSMNKLKKIQTGHIVDNGWSL